MPRVTQSDPAAWKEVPAPCEEMWVAKVCKYSSQYNSDVWAASHLVGPPHAYPEYGDLHGVWAPRRSKGEDEYLELQYAEAVRIQGMHIYETYNPGAVVCIKALHPRTGEFVEIYRGEPHQAGLPDKSRVFVPAIQTTDFMTDTIRIEMDTRKSRSWSEIDGVRVLFSRPWTVDEHGRMSQGCQAAVFTTLCAANRLAEEGLVPYLPQEIWWQIFENLHSADWAEHPKGKGKAKKAEAEAKARLEEEARADVQVEGTGTGAPSLLSGLFAKLSFRN